LIHTCAARWVRRSTALAGLACAVGLPWPGAPGLAAQGLESEAAFLTIPSGAAVVGLGRAATSLRDHRATFYNPAAGAWLQRPVFGLNRYDGPLGFLAHRVTATLAAGDIAVIQAAMQVQSFGEFTLDDEVGGTGSYEPQNVIAELGIQRALGQRLAVGARGKWIESRITGVDAARAMALDLGLLLAVPGLPATVGVALVDAGHGLSGAGGAGGEAPLPTRLRVGASGSLGLGRGVRLVLAADAAAPPRDWSALSRYAGVALDLREQVVLRAGRLAETLIETNVGTTFGMGFRLGGLEVDFARELGANRLGNETHISLGYRP
jgi:hypothetical protein